jgi:L-fuculose-phosphate aldolase
MLDDSIMQDFIDIGRDIFLRGLISSHAGNMSVLVDNTIYITRRGSMLGRLKPGDIIAVTRDDANDPNIARASTEYVVHEAIYSATDAKAIVHTHPPYATLLSFSGEIVPVDAEGLYYFSRVPVACPKKPIGSAESAELVSEDLQKSRIVLVRGHGSFARGQTLEEAFMLTTSLESAAFYLYHLK